MAAAQCRRVLERLRRRVGARDPDGRLLEQARRLALFELDAERAIAALRMQVLQGTHSIDEQRARLVTARDHLETAADELELRANLVDASNRRASCASTRGAAERKQTTSTRYLRAAKYVADITRSVSTARRRPDLNATSLSEEKRDAFNQQ